ncbi:MAG: FAD-dependent monooxygenase, partial [Devosia sp.]
MKALIAGAGIGGLASALFLHRAGVEVEIYEQSPEVRELGVGINLLPHAVQALASLGLLGPLDSSGVRTRELIYLNRFGQMVWREPRGLDAGYRVPQYSIPRSRLLGLLHKAVLDRIGPECVHVSRRFTAHSADSTGVMINLTDANANGFEARGDILIGADGIHSLVRASLYPGEGAPIWNGVMIWRGVMEWP